MATKIGQTNAQSSGGGNNGIDVNSIYLLYGGYEASFGLDGLDVYYFDLNEIEYDLTNLDGSTPNKSDFKLGQVIYALDEYGKYLKHIWVVEHLDETDDTKLIVSDYGEIKDTPLVEIIGTQATGTPNEYALEQMQYFCFMANEVVKVKFPSDDNEYTFVKSLVDDATGNLVFNRTLWDSTNSQYIIDTLTIDSNFNLVYSTETLASGGGGSQLYQHNITFYRNDADIISSVFFTIINNNPNAMSITDIATYFKEKGMYGSYQWHNASGMYVQKTVSSPVPNVVVGVKCNQSFTDRVYFGYSNPQQTNLAYMGAINETTVLASSTTWTKNDIVFAL